MFAWMYAVMILMVSAAKDTRYNISLGIILPLSAPANTSDYALTQAMRQLAELAIYEINMDELILPNIQVSPIEIDSWNQNHTDPIQLKNKSSTYFSAGLAAVRSLDAYEQNPNMVAVYGGFYSASSRSSAGVFSQYQIPMCGDLAGSPSLSEKRNYPYYYRIYPGKGIGRHIYQLLKIWSVSRVAVLIGPDEMNRNNAEDTIAYLRAVNIAVLTTIRVEDGEHEQALKGIVAQLHLVDARYILTFIATKTFKPIYFRIFDAVGPGHVWIGNQAPVDSTSGLLLPDQLRQLKGFILVTPKNEDVSDPEFSALNHTWVGLHNKNPDLLSSSYNKLDVSTPVGAYDCVKTLLIGIDLLLKSNPQYTPAMLETRKLQSYLTPAVFSNTGYHGAYESPIIIDSNGDLIIGYKFRDLVNNVDFAFTDINATQLIPYSGIKMRFNDGTTQAPFDGTPTTAPAIIDSNSAEGGLLKSFTTIGLLLCLLCAILLYVYSLNKIFVKAAPIFSGLIVFGAAMAYTSIGFLIGMPTEAICHLRLWFQLLGFVIALGAFLVKNYRIHMIFSSRTIIPKKKLSNLRFGRFFLHFVLFEIVLLTIWSILSSPKPSRQDGYNQMNSFQCVSSNPKLDFIATNLLYGYNSILLVLAALLAYLTRSVNSDYNESLFMFFFVIAAVLTSGTTINALQNEKGIRSLVIRSVATWMFTTFVLITFFLPKTIGVYYSQLDTLQKTKLSDMISSGKKTGGAGGVGSSVVGKRRTSIFMQKGIAFAVLVKPGWKLPLLKQRTESQPSSDLETSIGLRGSSSTVILSSGTLKTETVKFSNESINSTKSKPISTARAVGASADLLPPPTVNHNRSISSVCPLPSISAPGKSSGSFNGRRASCDDEKVSYQRRKAGSVCESLYSLTSKYRFDVLVV
ncbi:UNVERIFIED_CONTAM: hypothetical protein HDU68_009254 [Siphonaria sp. JEL0065]|nr:hypothetical protein HDU68_009254 [Siphonaria sp. JEL0065]